MAERAAEPVDSDVRAVFGAQVRALRLSRGLSQEDLAEVAGLHRTYISSLERGQRNVSLDNIHVLARALQVSDAELLGGGAP
ncbi:MAG: helix-turn-helix domain-containing protein [Actinomycetota bacterium]|nr:helix-turn-helix domain-containing protein [Actinomycetota bacterium]